MKVLFVRVSVSPSFVVWKLHQWNFLMTSRKKVQNKLPLIALPFHCCRLNIYLGTRVATLPVCTMKMRALWKADDPWIRFMFCSKGCKITFGCVATFGNFAFLISFHILQLMAFQDWVNAIRSREIIVSFETHDYSLLMKFCFTTQFVILWLLLVVVR